MNKHSLPLGQKGITPLVILIALAAVIVVGILAYGFFTANSPSPSQPEQAVSSQPGGTNPFEITNQTNPKDCLDTDYTGCDTSGDFMTWKDDGVRNPSNSSQDPSDYK